MRAVLCVAAIAFAIGCGKSTSGSGDLASEGNSSRSDRNPVAKVSANELLDEYLNNPLAADVKFKGKYVEIVDSGKVEQSDGSYKIAFQTVALAGMTRAQLARLPAREQQWYRDGAYPSNVVAVLNKSGEAEAAKLKGGERFSLVGRVKGSRKADVWRDVLVELDDATLTLVPSEKK